MTNTKNIISTIPFLDVNDLTHDVQTCQNYYTQVLKDNSTHSFNQLIIAGQGGSILPLKGILTFLQYHHERVQLVDYMFPPQNIDAHNSICICISRSGETSEILYQYEMLKTYDFKYFVVMTNTQQDNTLLKKAMANKDIILPLDNQVVGRYSFSSPSTLFPLLLLQENIQLFHNVLKKFLQKLNIQNYERYAKKQHKAFKQGKNILVYINTSHRFTYLSHWFSQLYGESLGKNGYFMTPLVSVWPQDLHSIFQLMIDGPKDKVFDILHVPPNNIQKSSFEISDSQDQAIQMIQAAEHPVRIHHLKTLSDVILLMYQVATETIFMAKELGIDPYNQPVIDKRKFLLKNSTHS